MPHFKSEQVPNHNGFNDISCNLKPSLLDIKVKGMIHHSRYSVYLAKCNELEMNYALKAFPYNKKGETDYYFMNECRFQGLSHQNVINFVDKLKKREVQQDNKISHVSYILYELAPFGNFHELIFINNFLMREDLARTFFKQLIDGIDYLHNQQIAHIDLKLENVLIGEGYQLKIADFDSCFKRGDVIVLSKGTKNYRCPVLKTGESQDPFTADVYSAGVILFAFYFGNLPYLEDGLAYGVKLQQVLFDNPSQFWKFHEKMHPLKCVDPQFKDLFERMTKSSPSKRITINEIKAHPWLQQRICNRNEVKNLVSSYVNEIQI